MFIISTFLLGATKAQDIGDVVPTYSPTALPKQIEYFFNDTDLDDCGNGVCDSGENCLSCAVDCISGNTGGFDCGNGVCEDGETCYTCPHDCNGGRGGEDYCCYGGKNSPGTSNAVSCKDRRCGVEGKCTSEESPLVSYCCGDGACNGKENELNCGIDECKNICGNGDCDVSEGENVETCSMDCHCNLDGICDVWETLNGCPLDCTCGNNVCNSDLGETVDNCMKDCACNANFQCESWEDEKNCPRDCGDTAAYVSDGHDANNGLDGTDQQLDGSNYDGMYDSYQDGQGDVNGMNDGGSDGDSGVCSDNKVPCAEHSDCCSFACDTDSKQCVG